MISSLTIHNLKTAKRIASREIRIKVAGTALGVTHYMITPIFYLILYTYVFSSVFVSQWGGGDAGYGNFALRLFVGLVPYQFFVEMMMRSPSLVLDNPSYIKKVVFPLEMLTVSAICSALFVAVIGNAMLLLVYLVLRGVPPISVFALPLLWIPLIAGMAGVSWVMSALGVYFRDLAQLATTFTPAMMFVTPIFFPLAAAPGTLQEILLLNPLTYFVENMRAALFNGEWPAVGPLMLAYALSLLVAAAGLAFFLRVKKGFADVV